MNATHMSRIARISGLFVAVALFAGIAQEVRAQAKGDGAKKLLELSGALVTPESGPIDYDPMLCRRCQDTVVAVPDRDPRGLGAKTLIARGTPTKLVARHACEGCGVDWVLVGHGKTKQAVAAHTCTGCGAEIASCCNTRVGSTAPTRGMGNLAP